MGEVEGGQLAWNSCAVMYYKHLNQVVDQHVQIRAHCKLIFGPGRQDITCKDCEESPHVTFITDWYVTAVDSRKTKMRRRITEFRQLGMRFLPFIMIFRTSVTQENKEIQEKWPRRSLRMGPFDSACNRHCHAAPFTDIMLQKSR